MLFLVEAQLPLQASLFPLQIMISLLCHMYVNRQEKISTDMIFFPCSLKHGVNSSLNSPIEIWVTIKTILVSSNACVNRELISYPTSLIDFLRLVKYWFTTSG